MPQNIASLPETMLPTLLFISTVVAFPIIKRPKIAQSGAAVGRCQRALCLLLVSSCHARWFANLASRRPHLRSTFRALSAYQSSHLFLDPCMGSIGEWDRRLETTSRAMFYALGCRVRGRQREFVYRIRRVVDGVTFVHSPCKQTLDLLLFV